MPGIVQALTKKQDHEVSGFTVHFYGCDVVFYPEDQSRTVKDSEYSSRHANMVQNTRMQ